MSFDEGPARPVPRSTRFPFRMHRTVAEVGHHCRRCGNRLSATEWFHGVVCGKCTAATRGLR